MILKAYIENYGSQAFDIVNGGVVKENFNETLDSGSINITNLPFELQLFPYQFIKLESTDKTFSKYYVVDNFVKSILNLDENIFDYVINLASPLKILEKVQLPNRTIIHSLVGSRETLATIINQMMTLYCPKVKYTNDSTWSYQYIFEWVDLLNDEKLTQTPCPDLSFNAPTLREVITTLMLVVGYLPTINHRELTFIDLRATQTEFQVQDGRIFDLKESNSIDSYVNTLQVQATNVLDTNNKVVNELIGFRDRNNVFLKHTENLKLETRFPIESIEKLEVQTFAKMAFGDRGRDYFSPIESLFTLGSPSTANTFQANSPIIAQSSSTNYALRNVVARFYEADMTSIIDSGNNEITFNSRPTLVATRTYGNITITTQPLLIQPSSAVNYSYIVLECTYQGLTYTFASFSLIASKSIIVYGFWNYDITDIVFEESKRKLLSKDYRLLANDIGYEEFKDYYYTTLSYQYGGKEITGFSNTWKEFTWFGEVDQNFMDTLWRILSANTSSVLTKYSESFFLPSNYFNVLTTNVDIETDLSKFSTFTFNIAYRPFNDINIRYTKELNDIPFAIEQLDKQEAGIPMLDEFSARETDKVNRLGNNVLQIHQSQASDMNYIQPLNSVYKNATIFSREIAFFDDCFEVNYVATKDYVLKNYFTALQTKYRAYEYVDYDQTILRKENAKIFVYIGTEYFNADDKVWYGTEPSNAQPSILWSSLRPYTKGEDETLKYQISGVYVNISPLVIQDFKNDLSVINYKNNIILNSVAFDSVSMGIYINDPQITAPQQGYLGGYIQGWYLNRYYSAPQRCAYSSSPIADMLDIDPFFIDVGDTTNITNNILTLPRIDNAGYFASTPLLYLCENKYASGSERLFKTYYKSQNEVLSQTLQFEYYTSKKEAGKPFYEFTEKFVEINNMVFDRSKGEMQFYGFANPTEISELAQDSISGTLLTTFANRVRQVTNRGIRFYIESYFSQNVTYPITYSCQYRTFKVVWYDEIENKYYDIFAIQIDERILDTDFTDTKKYNNGQPNAYFSLNDTKTLKVYKPNETSGIWEQTEEIATNTTSRILK